MGKLIELRFDIDLVGKEDAVLPAEREGPTVWEITPIYERQLLDDGSEGYRVNFRVAFEPDNPERRKQPYRRGIDPIFPDGWKYGDPWPAQEVKGD